MQILVLGMHRSGTSMVARLLNTMGVYFAPEGLSAYSANEDNRKGFWERRDVRTLNDQLLHAAGADWHRLGDFKLSAIPELTLAFFREEAAKIILSMDAHRPWFLKDPRLCVLAPLWLELLEFPICVFVHRSPLEVAASLATRNRFPIPFSCALWEFYNRAALNATLGVRRVQVNHRDLVRDPVGTVRMLGDALNKHGVRGLCSPSDTEILAFIDSSLVRAKAAKTDDTLTPAQLKLLEAFETGSAMRLTKPVSCSRRAQNVLRTHDRTVDPENKIGRLEADNTRVSVELAASKQAKADLQKALAESHTSIARRDGELAVAKQGKADLQKALTESHASIARRDAELAGVKQGKAELQKALTESHASIARRDAELAGVKQGKAELQKALAETRSSLAERNTDLKSVRQKLEIAELETKTSRQLGETFRRQIKSLEQALKQQIEGLREASKAEATNAKIRQLHEAIARRENEIQKITKSIRELGHDRATDQKQVRKLRQLLEKAATEIDRLRQSSRWKAGSIVLVRPRKTKKNEALEKYVGGFESWLEEKKRSWSQPDAAIAPVPPPVTKKPGHFPALCLREFDHKSIARITQELVNPVSIVVPIYNGASDLDRCVESVLRCTTRRFELILVDDCSSESAIGALLAKYETRQGIRILRQTENRGFVHSANVGMQAASGDVVLLNSDTEVTPGWLRKLTIAAYSEREIATVTPFSNAAGAFSVPEIGVNAPIPFPFTPLKMARLTARLAKRAYPEVPTGNGFCMYIKRHVLNEIGGFDEENFGRGYGEENDFCMRARKAGWRNIIDDSLFIYHRGNGSFGEEKQLLVKRNRAVIDHLHPEYTGLVGEFTSSAEINSMRARIGDGLRDGAAEPQLEKRRLLYILHEGSGGVPMTNADLVSKVKDTEQCFLLTSTGAEMILREWRRDRAVERKRWKIPGPWSAENFSVPALREIYFQVLVGLDIDLVHVRHLFKHSFDPPKLCRALGIPVVLSFHDYYFVCPSIHLLDQDAKFCGGQCTPGLEQCTIPSRMLTDLPMLKLFLPQWRERVSELIDCCDAFVTTAESVREVHSLAFPQLSQKPFWVIEHGRDLKRTSGVASPPRAGESIRILVAGNIDHHKGSAFIRQLSELDKDRSIEFHFLGQTDEALRDIGVHHGGFKREDFGKLARKIQPSCAAVFSIWAETYSHTLTEAWGAGLPVLGSKLGAVGERITQHGGGWLVDTSDPIGTLALIRTIASENGAYEKAIREVEKIRLQNVEGMVDAYRALYEQLLAKPTSSTALCVGCLVPPGNRGSTFMRAILPLGHERMRQHLVAARLPLADARDSLGKWVDRLGLQTIFLQREALDKETAAAVVETCRARKVRIVFEIDDNLLDLADSHVDYAFYEPRIETIRFLAENADQVIVSTPNLLEIFRPLNERISVIGNALDEWLWYAPVRIPERSSRGGVIVAGYMGTKTHRADLEVIHEPFLRARQRVESEYHLRLELEIVGGLDDDPATDPWYRRLEVPRGCTFYPRFVRWLRETLAWDFALAPLRNDTLNHSKSALKFLEYAGLGVPGIFSRVGEYSQVVEDRATGLLIDPNAPETWEDAIVEMAASSALREELGARARQEARARYLLGAKIPSWFAALQLP